MYILTMYTTFFIPLSKICFQYLPKSPISLEKQKHRIKLVLENNEHETILLTFRDIFHVNKAVWTSLLQQQHVMYGGYSNQNYYQQPSGRPKRFSATGKHALFGTFSAHVQHQLYETTRITAVLQDRLTQQQSQPQSHNNQYYPNGGFTDVPNLNYPATPPPTQSIYSHNNNSNSKVYQSAQHTSPGQYSVASESGLYIPPPLQQQQNGQQSPVRSVHQQTQQTPPTFTQQQSSSQPQSPQHNTLSCTAAAAAAAAATTNSTGPAARTTTNSATVSAASSTTEWIGE
nr:ORFB [Kluyveromyces lactis]